ncbi:type I methionyl aminopeptidase [Paenibacillus koleovorans]|uniref:type I methionyl aminopeptidase n=1 Tax=Paenibacillus koleovorans TaxID=121608 RepID=UPI000FD85390|nr:type I methionyl aminopeptidase [Paenibacillus koleovorans]
MLELKTAAQIEAMRSAGGVLAACHRELRSRIKPGVTTAELDRFAEQFMLDHGTKPEQKGYHGYPFATCASVNDVICHGFPDDRPLEDGDIVTIDMVVNKDGWLADSAWSYQVGSGVSEQAKKLLEVTKAALYLGIRQAVVGNRLGDIGHIIQSFAEAHGYGVVRNFTGHGIGQYMHEEPTVLHFGKPGKGMRLKPGMVLTIEPMLTTGTYETFIDADGWTARTMDGSLCAQYEHTIAITEDGPVILTDQGD